MSDAVAVTAPAAVPVAPPSAVASAEPTIESLSALVPDPVEASTPGLVESTAAPGAERTDVPAEPMQADAPEEEAKTEEVAPPAETTVDTEALARAEAAAKKAREGSRRFREMQEQQRQVAAEAQRAAREAERHRQEAEAAKKFQAELAEDPYAALKKLGMTDQDLAERALREGTPEAALHTLNKKLEAERQARLALEQRLENEQREAGRRSAEAAFARVADNADSYPRLSELSAAAQLAVARAALTQISNNGYEVTGLTDEQVAEAGERFLAPKKSKAKAAAPTPAPKPVPAKGSAKTLTNAVTTTRAVAPRPWHELSDDEQIAQIAASIPDPS